MEHNWSPWEQDEAYPETWYRYCLSDERPCCKERFGFEARTGNPESTKESK